MARWRCDLHMHSCLSPCGQLEMSPNALAALLAERGIQLAALTDHNAALNTPTFEKACRRHGIVPLSGLEVQSSEECHILCLFADSRTAVDFGDYIYSLLPPVMNRPEKTGDQVWVDENDEILGELDKFLITSCTLAVDEIARLARDRGGLAIPAHVDRPSFSLSSQLGFIPEGPWDALEVITVPPAIDTGPYPLTQSSDAHCLMHVARRSFELELPEGFGKDGRADIEAIRTALQDLR